MEVREEKVQISTKLQAPTVYIGLTVSGWNPGYCRVHKVPAQPNPAYSFNHDKHYALEAAISCSSWAVQQNFTTWSPNLSREFTGGGCDTATFFVDWPLLLGSLFRYLPFEAARMEEGAQARNPRQPMLIEILTQRRLEGRFLAERS